MTRKRKNEEDNEEVKKQDNAPVSSFDMEKALSTVNRFLLPGFLEYIKDTDIKTQRQFNKLYKEYGEMK